jgi:hypothetical protein
LGGGVCALSSNGSTISITNNAITGNGGDGNIGSYHGGGIWAESENSAFFNIVNNILAQNTATSVSVTRGGGIWVGAYGTSAMTIFNNTITQNTAHHASSANLGGGVNARSVTTATLAITNSICYGNTPDNNYIDGGGTTVTVGYSDIGDAGYPAIPSAPKYNIKKTPVYVNAAASDYHLQDVVGNDYIIDGGSGIDAQPPGLRTITSDMGAYGGLGAGTIGFVMPTQDDPGTLYIREDIVGTYTP